MINFWTQLAKPFTVLAPMDDVTDVVFRQIVAGVAPPDVFFTEFASSDGWCSNGRAAVMRKLLVEPNLSRPLVAQIWGGNPDYYFEMAKDLSTRGFSGIDINMGCPEKGICARGCCAALIKTPDKAGAIIRAVQAGTAESGAPLPVSVKTRLGYNHIVTDEWASFLLGFDLAALTIHGRTAKEMSKVPAHWDEIARVVKLRDQLAPNTLVIGNGDVANYQQGLQRVAESGVDGVMIGRGIFSDIFAFEKSQVEHSQAERFEILLRHLDLFMATWDQTKAFPILRKFFKVYVQGFPGASDLRVRLMEATTPEEVKGVINDYASHSAQPA